MNCSDIQSHLEAYALDALDSYHRSQVEEHLSVCGECRRALASFQNVVGELPQALNQISPLRPPPSLKAKIMRAAQTDQQARVIQEAFAPRASAATVLTRRRFNSRVGAISLALASLLVVLLVGGWVLIQQQMRQAFLREQAALTELDSLQEHQQELFRLASSQTRHELVLNAAGENSNVTGKVLLESNKPTVLFTAHNLPPLGLGERYFLWTVNRGAIQLVGQFNPDRDGFAMVVFWADRDDPILKQIFVTRQASSKLLPSSEHILEWKASPNYSPEEYQNLLSPLPTVIAPAR